MATVMEMPKLSDTMKEGAIARWLKKEGDKISAGSPVIEIETDKATMEYEAPSGGVLLKILVGDGGKCALQAPIAVIGKADEKWEDVIAKYNEKKSSVKQVANQDKVVHKTAPTVQQTQAQSNELVKASPLAKKIAADKGIDLKTLSGSGPNGRIIQRDLDSASSTATAKTVSTYAAAEVERIPLTNMRKTIARRLCESVNTAPHFYLSLSVNMTNLLNWRKDTVAKLSAEEKFSVNDVVIFLTSRALKRHPAINASWKEDFIEQYRDVHMSVAVALPNGLMTPVVRHADKLNIIQIAQETKRLVKIAKDGKLQPSDYAGGTFSISNLGMSGIEEFTAIINPPQAAILAVGSTIATPVAYDDGEIGVEQRMKLTLSCDHRVIDGAVGSEFLKTLKLYFEDPMSALFLG
ncbi:MAG: dihydrolipoamide acetyltransferase family protein [Bdellovibrionota bacterium]